MTGIPPIRYRAKIAAASFTVLSHPTVRTFLVMTLLTDTVTPLTDRRLSESLVPSLIESLRVLELYHDML
jgi:hypothetical protein